MSEELRKRCNGCGRELPLSAWYPSTPSRCKECQRAAVRRRNTPKLQPTRSELLVEVEQLRRRVVELSAELTAELLRAQVAEVPGKLDRRREVAERVFCQL